MRILKSLTAATAATALLVACGGGSIAERETASALSANLSTINVLSNRADLISGGDALVEVVLPAKAKAAYADVRVALNDEDVTSAFALRGDGRFYGLVSGLRDGANTVVARVPNGPGARIDITNHPIGGPVISGPQIEPWTCTTKVANPSPNNPDLGDPLDAQCNIAAPVYRYQYRTLAAGFAPYDPASPPAAGLIATTTTDQGQTVPYIVRIERGVINRGKYDLAYLARPDDPTAAWAPWSVPTSWNQKLFWKFGSGCDFRRVQANPGSVMDHEALSRGFMVASSEMTQYGTHCNDVTSAETVIMVKEYIAERYGRIRFTMADGASGGAHQQNLHASNYPGLLQGLMPTVLFQDTWTPGREFADCGLLKRYHDAQAATPLNLTIWQRGLVAGHRWNQVCEGPANVNMASRTPFYIDPAVGCGNPADQWSLANPSGKRCTLQDFNIAVFGPRDATGYAKSPLDNIGIQYGFNAFNDGRISAEQFVTMNEQIGGYDINGQWQPARMQADPGAAEIAHRSGRVSHGRYLGEVAILDRMAFNVIEEHYDFRSWVIRNRIVKAHGDHANQVIWRYKSTPAGLADRAFETMNQWLTNVDADTSARSLREKIVANKPAAAVDSCWRADLAVWSTDPVYCNTGVTPSMAASVSGTGADAVPSPTIDEWPVYRDTRVASGEPLASDIMKCQLKPLTRSDYAVALGDDQWSRLQAVFSLGVCDYSKPGIGQVAPEPWQTFMDGPGGRPLGAPPASKPGDGRGL
jgi:hypothetical protein